MSNRILLILAGLSFPFLGNGQSKAMENLTEEFPDSRPLVFYYSTLKMFVPPENIELKELIYDIEKIKVLFVSDSDISSYPQSEIKSDLVDDGYDEAMTIRHDGNDILVYVKEKNGSADGFFLFMEGEDGLTALDLEGTIPLDKIGLLTGQMESLKNARNFWKN